MCKVNAGYKGWIRLLLFVLGIVILNGLLTFLLVPAGNYARWVQHDAVTPENAYDLIAFGASECVRTWDPQTADTILGTHSFNMGSSATHINGGIYATFEDTMLHQKPDRVIFILGRYEMVSEVESPQSYIVVAPYLSSSRVVMNYYLRTIKMGGAMKRLFPWTEYHVKSWNDLVRNVKKKVSAQYLQYDNKMLSDYLGQGFWPMPYGPESIMSYDNMDANALKLLDNGEFQDKECEFNPEKIKVLKKMISYCAKNNCDVVVILGEVPVTSVFSTTYYNSYSRQLKELVERAGATYYDLNFAKKELWDPQLDYFYDASHINAKGAKSVTEAICKLLKMQDRGEDTSGLFYNSWEEYLASIDYIVATYMLVEESNNEVHAEAYCVKGTKVVPEFKFVLHNTESGYEEVLQDFDIANRISVPQKELLSESVVLRVYAREKGEESGENVRYWDYLDEE